MMCLLTCIVVRAHDIIFNKRNKERRETVKQAAHIDDFTASVMHEAAERGTSVGKTLYLRLPEPAANIVTNKYFDPWFMHLVKPSVWHWLELHVLFDKNGRIVMLHDGPNILWKENDNA